ncbi:unnamed protein product [marine sediment metagenome]|uniref:Uncharacterized protein n=1 Tax=marine sediment metagenome TaxID=412755 RepID=X1AMB9_9ZZZZ
MTKIIVSGKVGEGYVWVDSDQFTPEYLAKVKAAPDGLGWEQHREVLLKAGVDIE